MKKYKNLDYAKINQIGDVIDGGLDGKDEFEVPTKKAFENILKRVEYLEKEIKKSHGDGIGIEYTKDYYGRICLTDSEEKEWLISQDLTYKKLYSLYNKSNNKRRCRTFRNVYSELFGLSGQVSKNKMCIELLELIQKSK